jgi:general secretion pathway protein A
VAGAQKDLFSKKAVDRIYAFSGGFPRLINIICDHALLSAYAGDKKQISEDIVAECARDLEVRSFELPAGRSSTLLSPAGPNKKPESVPAPPAPGHKKSRLAIAALLVLLLIGGYAAYQWIPESAGWFVSSTETADTGRTAAGDAQSSGTLTVPENTAQSVSANPGAETGEKTENGRTAGKSPEAATPPDIRQSAQSAPTEIKPEPTGNIADKPADPDKPEPEAMAGPDPGRYADQKFSVNFPNGAYGLDPDSVEILDRVKDLLVRNSGLQARVTGYSDSLGDRRYNLHLSRIRANIVKSYLIGNGVDAGRIDSEGLGQQNPVATNETAEGRARNRRVEIVFDPLSR